jgi:hypothetical protein
VLEELASTADGLGDELSSTLLLSVVVANVVGTRIAELFVGATALSSVFEVRMLLLLLVELASNDVVVSLEELSTETSEIETLSG